MNQRAFELLKNLEIFCFIKEQKLKDYYEYLMCWQKQKKKNLCNIMTIYG